MEWMKTTREVSNALGYAAIHASENMKGLPVS